MMFLFSLAGPLASRPEPEPVAGAERGGDGHDLRAPEGQQPRAGLVLGQFHF